MAGSRLPQDEYDKRVKQCYEFRFEQETPFGVKEWLDYCAEHYPDKSQQQHTKMWSDAGELFKNAWKDRLEKLLGPAVDKITEGLTSEDPRTFQKAIEQVFRYSGHDIDRQEIKQEVTYYKANFGNDD